MPNPSCENQRCCTIGSLIQFYEFTYGNNKYTCATTRRNEDTDLTVHRSEDFFVALEHSCLPRTNFRQRKTSRASGAGAVFFLFAIYSSLVKRVTVTSNMHDSS